MLVPRELCLSLFLCFVAACTVPTTGVEPSCDDGVQNQDESDVDCGGLACGGCTVGLSCRTSTDCASGICDTLDSQQCEPSGACGNGLLEPGEGCDDGNRADDDGCSASCLKEEGAPCNQNDECASGACDTQFSNTCVPPGTCGNGLLEAGEGCDDGGTTPGDGCDESCLKELGELCTGPNQCASGICDPTGNPDVCEAANVCGNAVIENGEACDDGNETPGDGCNASCKKELDQFCESDLECETGICDQNESPSVCEPINVCGNGVVEGAEACDDGNTTASDGCSSGCLRENGELCSANDECASGACDTGISGRCVPSGECGNGIVEMGEACDDGNISSGDGCNALCKKELGQPCIRNDDCGSGICDQAGSDTCEPPDVCGNGVREDAEACDDGGTVPGDGCSPTCLFENNRPCARDDQCQSGICDTTSVPARCEPPNRCGNGRLEGLEACDDGNTTPDDGCAPNCRLEDGELCVNNAQCASTVCDLTETPDVCEPANTCGNSKLEDFEACDDGGLVPSDGCDADCLKENGQICANDDECASTVCDATESPDVCEPQNTCGNGRVEGAEACDDGNTRGNDGCNPDCLRENGQSCTAAQQCASGACDILFTGQCVPSGVCGNGILEMDEACDDGNVIAGDGCNSSCKKELGEACTSSAECGSGVCDQIGSGTCEPANTCGNGVEEGTEACDDGGTVAGDGCSAGCLIESGNVCLNDAQCESGVCDATETPDLCEPANTCGNGRVEGTEACDDGGTEPDDGCGPNCLLGNGAFCASDEVCESDVCDTTESPPVCEPANTCGNGKVEGNEGCDDGNLIPGDGCSETCKLPDGAACSVVDNCQSGVCDTTETPPVCEPANTCGNGTVEALEGCDDGGIVANDGCNAVCLLEAGERCSSDAACASGSCTGGAGGRSCDP